MGNLHLGLLLHFYQPPGQLSGVLRRIVDESYRPLIRLFREHQNARASFNINGVLTEMLDDHNFGDVIGGMAELALTGRVEIVGSGKYHPILPLIAPEEAARQIALNDEANARLLGASYRPRGFFPPEMAWDHAVAPLVAASGKEWVIMSGIACPVEWPASRVHREDAAIEPREPARGRRGQRRSGEPPAADGAVAVLFRDDIQSNRISFRTVDAHGFYNDLRGMMSAAEDRYIVIAMDAETFGHHIPGWDQEFLGALFRLLAEQAPAPARSGGGAAGATVGMVRSSTLSDIVDAFPVGETLIPRTSSWSTTRDDLDHGSPFPLWMQRGNELHRLLWRHLDQAMELFKLARQYAGFDGNRDMEIARAFADMALHSDQFWWASRRPHWSVNLVHRGLNMQRDLILNAVRALNAGDAPEDVRGQGMEHVAIARDVAHRITDRLFWD